MMRCIYRHRMTGFQRQFSPLVLTTGAIQLVPSRWGPVRFLIFEFKTQTVGLLPAVGETHSNSVLWLGLQIQCSPLVLATGAVQLVPSRWGPVWVLYRGPAIPELCMHGGYSEQGLFVKYCASINSQPEKCPLSLGLW